MTMLETQQDTPIIYTNVQDPMARQLLAKAQNLLPTLRERAFEAETLNNLPETTIADFIDAGFFKVHQPIRYGGYDLGMDVMTELVMTLSSGCGASGWVCAILGNQNWIISLFPAEVQDEVWGDDPDTLTASSFFPPGGRATPKDGGFHLEGYWKYSSGSAYAKWLLVRAIVSPSDRANPDLRFFLVPKRDFAVIRKWDTMGMKGTGSFEVKVQGTFVPYCRVLTDDQMREPERPGRQINPAPVYALPGYAYLPASLAACPIGIGYGAMDTYLAMIQNGTRSLLNKPMRELQATELLITECSAEIDTARLLLLHDTRKAMEILQGGQTITIEQRIHSRRNQSFAALLAIRAIERLFHASGAQKLAAANPLQRAFRDVQTISTHVVIGWDLAASLFGEFKLGKELTIREF